MGSEEKRNKKNLLSSIRGWLLECCSTLLMGSGAVENVRSLSSAAYVALEARSPISAGAASALAAW